MPQKIDFSRKFDKQLRKAPLDIKVEFRDRFMIFLQNKYHPLLNNHSLVGAYMGCRSINITGDWRAVYREDKDVILFLALGTHSQLYK